MKKPSTVTELKLTREHFTISKVCWTEMKSSTMEATKNIGKQGEALHDFLLHETEIDEIITLKNFPWKSFDTEKGKTLVLYLKTSIRPQASHL